jgi:hypothetical protein
MATVSLITKLGLVKLISIPVPLPAPVKLFRFHSLARKVTSLAGRLCEVKILGFDFRFITPPTGLYQI